MTDQRTLKKIIEKQREALYEQRQQLNDCETFFECYEERIQTLLNLKEANYRAYEELDKKIHDFSEWLEARLQEHQEKPNFTISASECFAIQQKFDEVFFAVKASPSNKPKTMEKE